MQISGSTAAGLAALQTMRDGVHARTKATPDRDGPVSQTSHPDGPANAAGQWPPPSAGFAEVPANPAIRPQTAPTPPNLQASGLSNQMLSVLFEAQNTKATAYGSDATGLISSDVAARLTDMLERALKSYGPQDGGSNASGAQAGLSRSV